MVPVISLALPILVSAIFVFVASSIVHMLLPFHRSDMKRVPDEDEFLAFMHRSDLAPGDYGAPHPGSPAGMKTPEFVEKMKRGPVVFMTIAPGRGVGIGKNLGQWFLYSVLVSIFAAYIAGRALAPGAPYLEVFRFAGLTAFLGYSMALMQHSIWYNRNWGTTVKSMIDGVIYGFLTGGVFGWLWPR